MANISVFYLRPVEFELTDHALDDIKDGIYEKFIDQLEFYIPCTVDATEIPGEVRKAIFFQIVEEMKGSFHWED